MYVCMQLPSTTFYNVYVRNCMLQLQGVRKSQLEVVIYLIKCISDSHQIAWPWVKILI